MDALGIVMTIITLFGMLALTIAHVQLGSGSETFGTRQDTETPVELKKAA